MIRKFYLKRESKLTDATLVASHEDKVKVLLGEGNVGDFVLFWSC